MAPHAGKIVINGAASQFDRWLAALDAGYAEVDGRSFPELLEFPVRFGALINFYDLANRIDGNWVDFFVYDPAMILAGIAAANPTRDESAFLALERHTIDVKPFDRKFELFAGLFAAILDLARAVNRWLEGLGPAPQSETARLLRQQIAAAIDNDLGAQLRLLIGYAQGAGLPEALGRRVPIDVGGFLPIWDVHGDCPDGSIYRGRSKSRKIDHACPYLTAIFIAFLDAISHLQVFARANLDASLEEADHKPHIALYIAFARLFRTSQATINTVSSRYIHFYYHDILREDFRAAVPDHVYLAFTLATDQDVASTTVPRGTLFQAGRDSNGLDILYAADRSLLVTAATIAKLRALRVVCGPLLVAGSGPPGTSSDEVPDEVPRRILSTEIAAGGKAASAPAGSSAWDTFGETEPGKTAVAVTTLATLGFAVASPYLLLTGGVRLIELRLRWSDASGDLACLLARIHRVTKLHPDAILRDVLSQAFTLYVSTADGWLPIEAYDVLLWLHETSFALQFALPPSAAPIVAYSPVSPGGNSGPAASAAAGAGANPDPTQPTLKVYLRQEPVILGAAPDAVEVYPLSLLSTLDLTDWAIDVGVSQLAGLQLANTDGPVDPTKPFLLLGAPPVLGSFLEIRHQELFAKTLASLEITIKWFNLPQNEDGFKGWYRDYVLGLNGKPQADLFDNSTFLVGICVVDPGRWNLAEDASSPVRPAVCAEGRAYLFRTRSPGSPDSGPPDCQDTCPAEALCPATEFNTLQVVPATPPSYYKAADSAVRLQLTAPPYAFGDDLYAQNVLSAVISDLPDPTGGPNPGPARCQEWKLLCDAAQWIGACLDQCAKAHLSDSGDAYKTCLTPCLEGCMLRLVLAAVGCALECLAESADTLGEARVKAMQGGLLALDDPSPVARARSIKGWIDQTRASSLVLPPALLDCLVRCEMLLDAVLCIWTCESEGDQQPTEKYRAYMISCLTSCMQQLEKPYEDCCKEIKYPNPPWLPQAESVAVDYTARCSAAGSAEGTCGRFYHLLPFDGYCEPAWPDTAGIPLLPDFPDPGNLYIGFSGLVPPQTLTLLFRMAAAGAAGWAEKAPAVTWSYLSGNRWIPSPPGMPTTPLQPPQILSDGTNGLQNSGILALALPAYDPDGNTVLDPDCQWLGATVAENPSLFPKTSRILPHALQATWQDNGSVAHLGQPLPPDTIKSSVEPLPHIATIEQPMESFGGRPPETGRSFQTWLGERLRHKDRGLLGWDYERLVLEQFPTVWKVQALPARNAQCAAPGNVLVVVVPGPNSIEVMDPTEPMASADLLGRIGASLETGISPFVTLQVANPIYVRITVTAAVLFADDEEPDASLRRLNDELVRYLSPWPDDAARAAKGGDYASEDEISEFIQTRPYVDALVSIGFTYTPDPGPLDWYFLTSAKQHNIIAADTGPDAVAYRRRKTGSAAAGRNA